MTIKKGSAPLQVVMGDVVKLRKPHPCGSFDWTVVRLGADIGLRCHGCQRKVLLPRRELEKRLKMFISRGPEYDPELDNANPPTSVAAVPESSERTD